jgi:tetratricopeptide (TPR) repeat protein
MTLSTPNVRHASQQALDEMLSAVWRARANPDVADPMAAQAVALARSICADEGRLGQACLLHATTRYRLFDYAGSLQLAIEAAELLQTSGDVKGRARAMNLCFIIHIETGELIRALEMARRALADARARGDRLEQARLLLNQAVVFDMNEEFGAAVRCLNESIALFEENGTARGELFVARVNLADAIMGQAEREGTAGHAKEEQRLRQCAAATIPGFEADAPPGALNTWISLKARLGAIEDARLGAITYLRRLRRAGHVERFRAYALLAVGELHVQAGRPDKGAHRLQRAVAILRAAKNWSHLGQTEARLARLYAERGDFAQALRWQRQAYEDGRRLSGFQQELRWRLAALEREAEARRVRRVEERMHEQRLAVIGRLLTEIYHALVGPIQSTHAVLNHCTAQLAAGITGPGLVPGLSQVLAQVDEATALVRQLKMFSYRAAPQSMEVSLTQSVQDAWNGVALWRRSAPAPLRISGERSAIVDVDAQRLAVLLRILFIEAERGGAAEDVRVEIGRTASAAFLRVSFSGIRSAAAAITSVGLTLCAEIAQEMNGQLLRAASPAEILCFELRLPQRTGDTPVQSAARSDASDAA